MNPKEITIISGGQSGVDRAALDFALENDLKCTGWCPSERWAEDGRIAPAYPLNETTSKDPAVRTELNVEDSHGTLIVYREEMDEGTLLTQQSAQKFNKPLFIINASISFDEENFRHWLTTNSISRLNIAGPRESNSPGIYKVTKDILTTLLKSTI